jgi:hypothetical protein
MKLIKMTCPSCNALINVPNDIQRISCLNCSESLILQRGEGYATLSKDTSPAVSKVAATTTEPHKDDTQTGEPKAVNQSAWYRQYVSEHESKWKSNMNRNILLVIGVILFPIGICFLFGVISNSSEEINVVKMPSRSFESIKTRTSLPTKASTMTPSPTETLEPSPTPTFTMAPVGVVTIKERANLRAGPGKAYELRLYNLFSVKCLVILR